VFRFDQTWRHGLVEKTSRLSIAAALASCTLYKIDLGSLPDELVDPNSSAMSARFYRSN